MNQFDIDLISATLLSCPHCEEQAFIEDFNNGVMIIVCQSKVCGSKWQITIKIEEI